MRIFWILLVGILPLMACQGTNTSLQDAAKDSITSEDIAIANKLISEHVKKSELILSDTVYQVKCMDKAIEVRFTISKHSVATGRKLLLLLPGWNYTDTQWCSRTNVCQQALQKGYDVLFVEMGKSVYMDSLYPEMRSDYRQYPTRTWLWDSVLKPLQPRGYFTNLGIPEMPITTGNGKILYKDMRLPIPCFVMGLSTGGRGAMLLGLEHPEAFRAIASLSGDYDPTLTPTDNLMINCMGRYSSFPWRWRGSNNINLRMSELKIPCFIGHGRADPVVSVKQAIELNATYLALKSKNREPFNSNSSPVFKFQISETGAHDYEFWNEMGLRALDFFESL